MIVTIDKIEIGKGVKKDSTKWERWVAITAQGTYSTFNPYIGEKLEVGKTYDLTIEDDGKYKTITEAKETSESPPEPPRGAFGREEAIMRGGCLHDAATIAAAMIRQGQDIKSPTILAMEDVLYQGLLRQMGVEK